MNSLPAGHAVNVAAGGSTVDHATMNRSPAGAAPAGAATARAATARAATARAATARAATARAATAGGSAADGSRGEVRDAVRAGQPASSGAGASPAVDSTDHGPVATYHLHIDGTLYTVAGVWIGASLLNVLRNVLGVTSVKDACEQGRCGACSVLIDGRLVAACTVLAADATDTQVTTVAGLSRTTGPVHAVQAALLAHGAVQCGYCTPGLVVAIADLLGRGASPDDEEIRESLAGNVCRCTGYGRIIAAVRALVDQTRSGATRDGDVAGGDMAAAGGEGEGGVPDNGVVNGGAGGEPGR
jgi:carbon-monoxide dehydrogenase small subunit